MNMAVTVNPRTIFPRELRDLAHVPRWVIARRIRDQSVAEHTFFVAQYALRIAQLIEWQGDYGELLRYALDHDLAESFTGDSPGPVKHAFADRERLTNYEDKHISKRFGAVLAPTTEVKAIVKCADGLDEVMWLMGEMQLGNQAVTAKASGAVERLNGYIDNLPIGTEEHRRGVRHTINAAVAHERNGWSNEDFAA